MTIRYTLEHSRRRP